MFYLMSMGSFQQEEDFWPAWQLVPLRAFLPSPLPKESKQHCECLRHIAGEKNCHLIPLNRIDDAKTNRQFKSGLHAATELVKRHGPSELYRGLVSTTIKQSATSAVRMGTYNILKEMTKKQGIASNVFTSFGTGALAGIVTVYATQPFDTIKTRAQSVQGAGIVEAVRSVMQDYGIKGFWKGSSMRLGRLFLSGGIVFSVYEQVSALLAPATSV